MTQILICLMCAAGNIAMLSMTASGVQMFSALAASFCAACAGFCCGLYRAEYN